MKKLILKQDKAVNKVSNEINKFVLDKKLWKDTLNGKIACAYQFVIDSFNDRDMTGEIQEAFDLYVSLLENQREYDKKALLGFIDKNSWGDDTGRILIDATDLISLINGS